MIIFLIFLWYYIIPDHCEIVRELEDANDELEMAQRIVEEEKIDLEDSVQTLKDKNHILWSERPIKYLRFKENIKNAKKKCIIM